MLGVGSGWICLTDALCGEKNCGLTEMIELLVVGVSTQPLLFIEILTITRHQRVAPPYPSCTG